MNIISLSIPGRFPTVVHDPGHWWEPVASLDGCSLHRYAANEAWWRVLCSPSIIEILSKAQGADLQLGKSRLLTSAAQASRALDALCEISTYRSRSDYVREVSRLSAHIDRLNAMQQEFGVSIGEGACARLVDYGQSSTMSAYALRDTGLSLSVQLALTQCPEKIALLLLPVASPQELLLAMMCARHVRLRNSGVHVCLADHGYENFSLRPHLKTLHAEGHLFKFFDSIIESRDDRDLIVPALARAVQSGAAPVGLLTREAFRLPAGAALPKSKAAAPPIPTFSPEPILWTRVSERRCYWSRCTFCIQNAKYDARGTPQLSEVDPALDKLEACIRQGYRTFIFADEALSPSLLRELSNGILTRGLKFRWACRCKLELSHTQELFNLMTRAGCYEVLYGLESISPRMQKRMDKFVKGLGAEQVQNIIQMMDSAGIGVHLNIAKGCALEIPRRRRQSCFHWSPR